MNEIKSVFEIGGILGEIRGELKQMVIHVANIDEKLDTVCTTLNDHDKEIALLKEDVKEHFTEYGTDKKSFVDLRKSVFVGIILSIISSLLGFLVGHVAR